VTSYNWAHTLVRGFVVIMADQAESGYRSRVSSSCCHRLTSQRPGVRGTIPLSTPGKLAIVTGH
jgi:hypothetical protein